MDDGARLAAAWSAFDAANADDPHREQVDGRPEPKELVYGRRMSGWLARLAPDASEALRLAARCQHLRRWLVPRSDYPLGKAGYLKWRNALKRLHADHAGEILAQVGYDPATIERVQSLVRKERLKTDTEAQTLEDVACLVFLEHHLADFAVEHETSQVLDILRKTWAKMSSRGHEAALALAPELPADVRALLDEALAPH